MIGEIKYCKFCNKEKPIEEFVKSGFAIRNICRECQNKKQTQIYRDSKKVKELEKENKELKKQIETEKEQVEYLRRSVERKESTISEMEQERIPYTNEYVKKLEQQLQQKEDIINKAKEYIKDNANIYTNIMGKEVGFFKRHNDGWTPIELLEILDNKGE